MMDMTFISVHDLSSDCRLLYVSNSISDILGYHPEEVIGKSCWDYFHPDEVPFAQSIHGRGVQLDKAAVLNYCQIKSKTGQWIGCECVFTVVHDVMVGCTSIYRKDTRSQRRANDAPIIRQLFSSSPKDPRYHMLSYISAKFSQGPKPHIHEPRAALFLNRFTRTLTIMYATNGLEKLLGISAAELTGKSFYYCIQENCLPEAVRCLESAKANDSIAYLRFWYRDPRQDDVVDHEEHLSDSQSSDQDSEDGGVRLGNQAEVDNGIRVAMSVSSNSSSGKRDSNFRLGPGMVNINSRTSSGATTDVERNQDNVFDSSVSQSSASSVSVGKISQTISETAPLLRHRELELEAVVSCTSDGLVVIIRSARPFVPDSLRPPPKIIEPKYDNGLFASPWAHEPIVPDNNASLQPEIVIQPSDQPQEYGPGESLSSSPPREMVKAVPNFMDTIREVAVFAWALTGINDSLAQYSRGHPAPGAQPYEGLPVWNEDTTMDDYDRMEE